MGGQLWSPGLPGLEAPVSPQPGRAVPDKIVIDGGVDRPDSGRRDCQRNCNSDYQLYEAAPHDRLHPLQQTMEAAQAQICEVAHTGTIQPSQLQQISVAFVR
jgi:hypothetical protein